MDGSCPNIATVSASAPHSATVIFSHGLGQSNLSWRQLVREVYAERFPHVTWILPQAPHREITLSPHNPQPSWFDISRLPPPLDDLDETALAESSACIENIILSQVHAGIDPRRIVLVGFAQGAALSLSVALSTLYELGGVASLSGWLPGMAREHITQAAPNLPILWCHGSADDDIPISYAEEGVGFILNDLRIPRCQVSFRQYPGMRHSICDAELEDLARWLENILGNH